MQWKRKEAEEKSTPGVVRTAKRNASRYSSLFVITRVILAWDSPRTHSRRESRETLLRSARVDALVLERRCTERNNVLSADALRIRRKNSWAEILPHPGLKTERATAADAALPRPRVGNAASGRDSSGGRAADYPTRGGVLLPEHERLKIFVDSHVSRRAAQLREIHLSHRRCREGRADV